MIIASIGPIAASCSTNIVSLLYAVAALATNSININNLPPSTSILQPTTTTATISSTATVTTQHLDYPASGPSTKNFEFENGTVQLEDPWNVRLEKSSSSSPSPSSSSFSPHFGTMTLRNPKLLGYGGGGAVFSYQVQQQQKQQQQDGGEITETIDDKNEDVAVKVSWSRSVASVENECNVLQTLENRLVSYSLISNDAWKNGGHNKNYALSSDSGIERCLGRVKYGPDPKRSVIFLQPVLPSTSISSISDLGTIDKQKVATQTLIRTTAQMLASGIVTSDVQPLMDPDTGRTVLVDLTEAKVLGFTSSSSTADSPRSILTTSRLLNQQDIALINSFCTEIAILIPESLYDFASDEFIAEITRIEKQRSLSLLFHTDGQTQKGNSNHDDDGSADVPPFLLDDANVQQILVSLPFANDDMVQFLEGQSSIVR